MKKQLERAAIKNGRSLSQEAEFSLNGHSISLGTG